MSTSNSERIINEIINKHCETYVEVVNTSLPINKSCSIKTPSGAIYMCLDLEHIDSAYELRSCVYHELGHCLTDGFYSSEDPLNERLGKEIQAVNWAVLHCIPFSAYLDAIRDGVRDVWALSEYFTITIESALKVIEFYESKLIDYIRLAKEVRV